MDLNNLVKAAIFTATAIALGFIFMLIPNVEFISVTVFLSGLIFLPLLFGQVIAMSLIGIFGALTSKILLNVSFKISIPIAGTFGFISAICYDGLMTISYPISAGYNWEETITYAISGLIFTAMHVVSNTLIFSIVVPGYLHRISQ